MDNVTEQNIKNCFRKANFVHDDGTQDDPAEKEIEEEEAFEDDGLPICADENLSASEIEETENNIIIEDEEICDPYSNISCREALESLY